MTRLMNILRSKTWFKSQNTCYGKFTQCKSGQAPKEITERQKMILEDGHQMQGTWQIFRLLVPGPRSQCIC